jgi:hypothetical protein
MLQLPSYAQDDVHTNGKAMMTASVLSLLRQFAPGIPGAASRQPPVGFVADTWRRWPTQSSDHGGAGMKTSVDDLLKRFGGPTVSRDDLRRMALEGTSADANRALFVDHGDLGPGKEERTDAPAPHARSRVSRV